MRGRIGLLALCGALALGCADTPAVGNGPKRALTLLHTADIHSRVWPARSRISRFEAELGLGEALSLSEVGGLARLSTVLKAERQQGDALWLDSGDALEGAEVFHRFGGSLELELLSALGLGAMALGNHELSLDDVALGQLFDGSAAFPVLAANLRPRGDSALSGRLTASALLEAAGVRVGVIGVAHPSSPPALGNDDNPWRLELAPELTAAVQAAINELTPRAALIVVLSHLGLDRDHALVAATSGVDLVLGGHQHVLTAEPEWQNDCDSVALQERWGCSPRRVPIVHSGAYARWLSRLELSLQPDAASAGGLELVGLELRHLPLGEDVAPDPTVAAYLEERRPPAQPPLAFLSQPLGRRSALAGDSALGNLTTDAMRAATSADVAIVNSSGLRSDLEAGPLLRSDLELAFPFEEPWRLVWLRGAALRRALERAAQRSAAQGCESTLQISGLELRMHCDACQARSAACLEITRPGPLGGVGLADDAWLLVALPEYLTLGTADFNDVGQTGTEVEVSPVDAIAKLLRGSEQRPSLAACMPLLRAWSPARCREGFGALDCPLGAERVRAVCSTLPAVERGRDGRIDVRP